MKSRYNPYYQQIAQPYQSQDLVYQPEDNSRMIDRYANLLQQRQGEYDTARAGASEFEGQIGGMQTYSPEMLEQRISNFTESTQKMIDSQYNGDWGAARHDLLKSIAKEKSDPFYKLMNYQNQQAKSYGQAKSKYGNDFIDNQNPTRKGLLEEAYAAQQSGEGDPYEMLSGKYAERDDYARNTDAQFAKLTGDMTDRVGIKLGENGLLSISEKALTDKKIATVVENGVDSWLNDNKTFAMENEGSSEEIREAAKEYISGRLSNRIYSQVNKSIQGNPNPTNGDGGEDPLKDQTTITGDIHTDTTNSDWLKDYDKNNSGRISELSGLNKDDLKIAYKNVDDAENNLKLLFNDKTQEIPMASLIGDNEKALLKNILSLHGQLYNTTDGSINKKVQKEYYVAKKELEQRIEGRSEEYKSNQDARKFYKKNEEKFDTFNKYKELFPDAFANQEFNDQLEIFADLSDKEGTYANEIMTYGNDNTFRNKVKSTISEEGTFESAYVRNHKTGDYELIKATDSKNYTSIDTPGKKMDGNLNIKEDYNYKGIDNSDGSLELESKDKAGYKVHVYPTKPLAEAGKNYKDVTTTVNQYKVAENDVFMNAFNNAPGFTTISMKIFDRNEDRVISKTVPIRTSKLREFRKGNDIDRELSNDYVVRFLNSKGDWSKYNTVNVRGQSIQNNFEKGYTNEKF